MSKGVAYFLVGSKRSAVALVSFFALRKFYQGPVCVFTSSDFDFDIQAKIITSDKRLNLDLIHIPLVKVPKHAVHTTKTTLHRFTPFEKTVFFDADTIPLKPFDELFPIANELVLTQFSDWLASGRKIAKRLNWWVDICPDLVEKALAGRGLAVNTGVYGFTKSTDMLEPWHELCVKGCHTFIPDEISAQLLCPHYPVQILDDRWNCSPVYGVNTKEVCLWHCHGSKHLRPATGSLWTSLLKECWDENMGRVREWLPIMERCLIGV